MLIISGQSGSGKSTLAETLKTQANCIVCTADDFFLDKEGNYNFDAGKLGEAHNSCQVKCFSNMALEMPLIILANTTTTKKEAKPYLNAAKVYGYKVHWVFLAKTHNNKNVHGSTRASFRKPERKISKHF